MKAAGVARSNSPGELELMPEAHLDTNPSESKHANQTETAPAERKDWPILIIAAFLGLICGGVYFINAPSVDTVLRLFHLHYYKTVQLSWRSTTWMGVPVEKSPLDMWVYQEILQQTRPDVLIEAGTAEGGSAYYYATIFDLLGHGRVITIDIEDSPRRPKHPRITYLLGSSTGDDIVAKVKSMIAPGEKVMVSLDSDHRKPHVSEELKIYSDIVTPGHYMVVEDTNINGHPVLPDFGPGPMEALQEFLSHDTRYVSDRSREKFAITFFPQGWLKRVR
jgi:cephalosporin hydroxylase